MTTAPTEMTVAGLRRDTPSEGFQGLPDDELLDRFLGRDGAAAESAFRTLVRRHGPMVLGVCRHTLERVHDAEDAFQATFLALARKAGSIRDRRALGRWLYEVAYRIAVRSKTDAARRRAHERQGAELSAVAPGTEHDPAWVELRPVLHEEVNRLPEKYRRAVVLCYLEGRTNEEAAELLNWPVGTVKGRLSRARDLLRSRLTRRGLALSAAFLATSLAKDTVFAELVPSGLVDETVRTALLGARGLPSGGGVIPPRVAELADDALRSTLSRALRRLAAWPVLLVLAVSLILALSTALTTEANAVFVRVLAPAAGLNTATSAPTPCH